MSDEVPIAEIAAALARSELWVKHMLRSGGLPSLRRPDVDTFIAQRREVAKALAEIADTEWTEIGNLPRNSALHRAGATVMRRNGFTESEIIAAYGYSPDSIEPA